MKWFLVIVFTFFCVVSCQFKTTETPEVDFTDYYFYINSAMLAQEQDSVEAKNAYLWKAYDAFPEQDKVPMYEWLIEKLIETHDLADSTALIQFLGQHEICANKKYFVKNLPDKYQSIVLSHGKFSQVTDYYHKQAEALQANFDTLLAMDQYVRGKEAIYAHLVPEKFKSLSMEEVDSMNVYNLLELYEKYGDVGHYSCETCHDLLALYVHVTDYDRFMLLNDYLLKMVKIGYLTPNKYAWAFDRPYHRKFDTSYYYFSMSPPISLATIETLTEAEQIEVNKRRRKIGLAPLPHLHEFITAHEL